MTEFGAETGPERETGVGTLGTWVRFVVILGIMTVPLFFFFRAGARKVGEAVSVAGTLTWGHEVRAFQACGDERVLWVVAEPPVLNRLIKDLEVLAEGRDQAPYTPVFALLTGREIEGEGSAFAADYDGRFQVMVVDRLAPADLVQCPES